MSETVTKEDADIRRTAIDVMKKGGTEIADAAYWKWRNGEYGRDMDNKPHLARWKAIREKIAELCSELRK